MANTLFCITRTFTNAVGQPLAGLSIALLTGTINGASPATTITQPGSPLATVYADPQAGTLLTNPTTPGTSTITTDGAGNLCSIVNGVTTIGVWVSTSGYGASPYFVLQAYGSGIVGTPANPNQQLIPISFPSGGGGS